MFTWMFAWLRNLFTLHLGAARSPKWNAVRKLFVKKNPKCAICGKTGTLLRANAVHHKKPFNAFPELELSEENLVTLCESRGMSCHITFGHLGNFKFYNPDIDMDIDIWKRKINERLPNKRSFPKLDL